MKLYKYRFFNEYTCNSLLESYIWLSSPDTFNDPFDCHLKDDYLLFDDSQLSAAALEELTGHGNGKDYYDNVIYPWYLTNGIGCFCESHEEILLWSHYANCHRGICLEYDFSCNKNLEKLLQKVIYTDEYPQINFSQFIGTGLESSISYIRKAFYTKYKVWEYEKEWRLVLPGYPNKKLFYPPYFLSAVYLGCNISAPDREWVTEFAQDRREKLPVFQYHISEHSFRLETVQIA